MFAHRDFALDEPSSELDELTGLFNHRAFTQVEDAVRARLRHGEVQVLALLDVDDLFSFNAERGRDAGDHMLAELAKQLRRSFAEATVYRVKSDEFALVFWGISQERVAARLNRFCFEVRRSLSGVTVSAGLASITSALGGRQELCAQAKAALREAKNRGRANAVAFDEMSDRSALVTSERSRALRRLIAEGRVGLAFQVIWDLARCAAHGFEVLARPHPGHGFAGPQEAFDAAEKLGRAHELDAVCRTALLARGDTLAGPGRYFVNVSPQSLTRDLDSLFDFAAKLSLIGIAPEQVVLEITERANVAPATIARAADYLRTAGFKLALDDCGVGNSGLEILSSLQVDYLKIDRSLIAKACTDRVARGVLVGVATIAKENGSYVVAEGIENDIMLDLVREVGNIDGVQGYLVGLPGPAPDTGISEATARMLSGN